MTYEDLCTAFEQLYPVEFRHVMAAVRVGELEREIENHECVTPES